MSERREELFNDYFESIFKPSNELTPASFAQAAAMLDALYGRFLPADRDAAILDVGCGTGQFLHYLKEKGFAHFRGIDLSPGQIAYCREKVTTNAEQADAFSFLSHEPERYQLITANDVLEHIPKDRTVEFLALVHGALVPGGTFLMKCPNMGNPFALQLRYRDFTHESGFTDTSLYQVLYLAGFRRIEILPSPLLFTGIKGAVRRPFVRMLTYLLVKLYWWQGFVAPRILSPVLVARAVKE